ncbi:MAG: Peptidase C39 family protein [Tenericutes bacterium ADurb.Bin087]|nr:MAG: Peptidase C39 family protein [Tenericutes bacterium ADurb.Bin087]
MNLIDVRLTQTNPNECGKTVLRMLLAFTHRDKHYLTLPLSGNFDNFLAITKKAKEHGVELLGYKLDGIEEVKNVKGPFVMHLSKDDTNHFVLAEYKKGKLSIADPSGEFYVLSLKTIEKYFISNILVVNCVESVKSPPAIKFTKRYTALFFHTLFLALLLLGFAFLGHISLDLISYVSFTLAAIVKIVEQQVIMNDLQKFDTLYIAPRVAGIKENFTKKFEALQHAKQVIFSRPLQLFSAITSTLLITIILVLNNYYFVIISMLLIVVALLEVRSSIKGSSKTFNLEAKISNLAKEKGEGKITLYNDIISDSTNIAAWRVYRSIIIHFSLGVLIFVLMYFSDVYSLNFLIFYFFGFSYYLYELKKLFSLALNSHHYYSAVNVLTDISVN